MENGKRNQKWTKVAEIELVYKSRQKASERPVIYSPGDAYEILMDNWNLDLIELQEQFKILLLNKGSKVLGIVNLSTGGKSGTLVDSGLVLVAAIKSASSSIILAHNHPSGRLVPSKEDVAITQKIKAALGYHDIVLADQFPVVLL